MNEKKLDYVSEPFGKTCSLCGEDTPETLKEDPFNKGFYICEVCLERTQRHDTMVRLGLEIQPEHD
jgi:formylmethanofuran dehydrogenase subunit E